MINWIRDADWIRYNRNHYHGSSAMVMIFNNRGEILLNLRDDREDILYPNHWAILGGSLEEEESKEEAAHREVEEEIGITISNLDLYGAMIDDDGNGQLVWIFTATTDKEVDSMNLQEGQDLRYFNLNSIDNLKITPFIKEALLTYRENIIDKIEDVE